MYVLETTTTVFMHAGLSDYKYTLQQPVSLTSDHC